MPAWTCLRCSIAHDRGLWVGLQVCVHGRQKSHCRDCGGSQICAHGGRKNSCKECRGHARTIGVRGCRERVDGGQLADADGAQDGEVPRSSERRLDEALVMAEEPTKEQREFALLTKLGMVSAPLQ